MIDERNVGWLIAIVEKEIAAGRPVEITGGIVVTIKTREEFERKRERLCGKFGEVIQWRSDRTALIATRVMPAWAAKILEAHIWEALEMERWR